MKVEKRNLEERIGRKKIIKGGRKAKGERERGRDIERETILDTKSPNPNHYPNRNPNHNPNPNP